MTVKGPVLPERQSLFSARRLTLMASVAALSAAVFLASPGSYQSIATLSSPAIAAEAAGQQPAGFADLVAKVKPAVVSVRVKFESTATAMSMNNDEGRNTPSLPDNGFDRFFRQFGPQNMPNLAPRQRQMVTGEGSGFFISSDGYIVTNNHVVNNAKSVQVTADDGTIYTAKVIGTDPKTDLALIKVDGKTDFPFVKFADHEPRIGDWVVAVGNPFGLGGTVTAGIVSARGRDIGSGPYDDYLQIDAPINKGNSGGPAFDISGNVIGVNTAIYSPSGGSVGIGFDIPADTAKLVVAQLKDNGHVTRGWLGVQIQAVTPAIADSIGMKKAEGALVAEPQAGSPAAKAGIEAGDVITSVNGNPIKDSRELARRISGMAPGSSVKLDLLRKGESKTVQLALAEMPNERQANAGSEHPGLSNSLPHLGLSLAPAKDRNAGDQGLVVVGVEPDGPAAEQGFKSGDVILDVSGQAVSNVSDVQHALTEAQKQGKHDVLMRVKTANGTRFIAVPMSTG